MQHHVLLILFLLCYGHFYPLSRKTSCIFLLFFLGFGFSCRSLTLLLFGLAFPFKPYFNFSISFYESFAGCKSKFDLISWETFLEK